MQITGHKTPPVCDRYDIVNENDLPAAMGKFVRCRDRDRSGTIDKNESHVTPPICS
jgi:hypothetical protein